MKAYGLKTCKVKSLLKLVCSTLGSGKDNGTLNLTLGKQFNKTLTLVGLINKNDFLANIVCGLRDRRDRDLLGVHHEGLSQGTNGLGHRG